ncbi:hypothetical protein BP6252_10798 [Coleophoma cylindrospora]|uniref:Peptidase M20 domain-containing protein 2 n=1 Tax=Coleophoma cylindrospora TaxID=1849047 RepID=A0A3D8QN53_9HELO|nr:hypothetical protein BP6252_10798 [Coleophoma cylindrospora]
MAPTVISSIDTLESSQMNNPLDNISDLIAQTISKASSELREPIRHIYTNPELAFEESIAHDTICDFVEKQGYAVTRKAYGVETSFEVISGKGGRLISINAEYDALPGIGHACGHHLIATAGISAFLGLSAILKARGILGRVQLLGTPAEESGGGKLSLLKSGAYKGVDVALMSHPAPAGMLADMAGTKSVTALGGIKFLATKSWIIEYFGKSTHASVSPWDGVNAYDAAVAAHVNIGLIRQQIRPAERVHGCMLEGPKAANVIGQYTKLKYMARSDSKQAVEVLEKKVLACFEAAGLATGCEVKITSESGFSDVVNNKALCERYAEIGNAIESQKIEVFCDKDGTGSTDFGNVSHVVPGLHSMFAVDAPASCGCHQLAFTAATGTEDAFQKALFAGELLARLGLDLIEDNEFYHAVKTEWEDSTRPVAT